MHPNLDKDRLFEEEERSLEHLLISGIASLDCNLPRQVKHEIFAQKNVIILCEKIVAETSMRLQ